MQNFWKPVDKNSGQFEGWQLACPLSSIDILYYFEWIQSMIEHNRLISRHRMAAFTFLHRTK
jgi:hypothetical protein